MGKAWIIASGKGGVGKSTITSALATALCRMKQTVCIVDADIGLRDQDVILGMENRVVYDLTDVCAHRCTLPQALIQHTTEEKLYLLPREGCGSQGLAKDRPPAKKPLSACAD